MSTKVKIHREPDDISPKVTAGGAGAVLGTAVTALIVAIATGGTAVIAAAAGGLAAAIVGTVFAYFKHDTVA